MKKIVKELETNDCQYHLVVYPNDMLKLNIDIDGMHMNLFKKIYEYIDEYFKSIGVNRINFSNKFNLNGEKNVETKTEDYVNSHITFTNICATSSKQK